MLQIFIDSIHKAKISTFSTSKSGEWYSFYLKTAAGELDFQYKVESDYKLAYTGDHFNDYEYETTDVNIVIEDINIYDNEIDEIDYAKYANEIPALKEALIHYLDLI